MQLPIQDIRPNPFQPRKTVDPAALEEDLAARHGGRIRQRFQQRLDGVGVGLHRELMDAACGHLVFITETELYAGSGRRATYGQVAGTP